MLVCVTCRREMRCERNGVGVDFGGGHVYPGDRFRCPGCGAQVIRTNAGPSHDPGYIGQSEYLKMPAPKARVQG